jgi:hypothetical protein
LNWTVKHQPQVRSIIQDPPFSNNCDALQNRLVAVLHLFKHRHNQPFEVGSAFKREATLGKNLNGKKRLTGVSLLVTLTPANGRARRSFLPTPQ